MGYFSKQRLKGSDRQRKKTYRPREVKVDCVNSNYEDAKVQVWASWKEQEEARSVTYLQSLHLTAEENFKIAKFTIENCSVEERQEILLTNSMRLFENDKDLFIFWFELMLTEIHRCHTVPVGRPRQSTECGANAADKLQSQVCAFLLASMKMEEILEFLASVVAFKEISIEELGLAKQKVKSAKRKKINNIGDACAATCKNSKGKSGLSFEVANALTNAILKAIQKLG